MDQTEIPQTFRPLCAAARRCTDCMTAKRCQPLLGQAEAKGLHFSLHDFPSENIMELSETDLFLIRSCNISVKQPKHPEPGATTYKIKNLMAQERPPRTGPPSLGWFAASSPLCHKEGRAPVSPAQWNTFPALTPCLWATFGWHKSLLSPAVILLICKSSLESKLWIFWYLSALSKLGPQPATLTIPAGCRSCCTGV